MRLYQRFLLQAEPCLQWGQSFDACMLHTECTWCGISRCISRSSVCDRSTLPVLLQRVREQLGDWNAAEEMHEAAKADADRTLLAAYGIKPDSNCNELNDAKDEIHEDTSATKATGNARPGETASMVREEADLEAKHTQSTQL